MLLHVISLNIDCKMQMADSEFWTTSLEMQCELEDLTILVTSHHVM